MPIRIRNLGIFCIAVGILGAIGAYAYSDYAAGGGGFLAEYIPGAFTSAWIVFVYVLMVPYIIAGVGLMQLRSWSRPAAMIVLTCGLVSIPFGTAIGIYGLSLLTSDEVDAVFSPRFNRL